MVNDWLSLVKAFVSITDLFLGGWVGDVTSGSGGSATVSGGGGWGRGEVGSRITGLVTGVPNGT